MLQDFLKKREEAYDQMEDKMAKEIGSSIDYDSDMVKAFHKESLEGLLEKIDKMVRRMRKYHCDEHLDNENGGRLTMVSAEDVLDILSHSKEGGELEVVKEMAKESRQ